MRPNSTIGKVRLEVRLSPKLRQKIIDAAAQEHMSISEYCTMILSNNETSNTLLKIHQSNKRIEELYYKVGNNVNQLARLCNGRLQAPNKYTIFLLHCETKHNH